MTAREVEYSLHAGAMREGVADGFTHEVSCVITNEGDTWSVNALITKAHDKNPRRFDTTISQQQSRAAQVAAVEWLRGRAAHYMGCLPGQVIFSHEVWQLDE